LSAAPTAAIVRAMSETSETSETAKIRATIPPAPTSPPTVLVRATRAEAAGAVLEVGGLRVIDRTLRQLARQGIPRVVIASDGAIALPAWLSPSIEVRRLDGPAAELPAQLIGLEAELGQPAVLPADVVRVRANRFDDWMRVVDAESCRAAEDAVFADLLRGDLGLVARHINKRVSFAITRRYLCHWPVTPNQVTLGAGVIGLIGCFLIATGSQLAIVAGFLLAQFQSILDGCDGELARVRFQQTAIGEWLDTIVDDALNLALVASVGVGLSRHGGTVNDIWIALGACGMLLVYNIVAYRELVKQGEGGEVLKVRWWFAKGESFKDMTGSSGGLFSWINIIGKRDFFVFAWLILAILDLLPVVLLYAFVLALAYGGAALGQLVLRPGSGSRRRSGGRSG
jgi:phosphatidylglycerophosphate synthase